MEKIFSNIKENMNKTVLKEINFDDKNKEKVRQAIYKKRKKTRFHLKPTLRYLLSISVACLFLLGMGYYIADKLEILPGEEQMASSNNKKEDVQQEHQNESNLYTPPAKEESYEDMTKEEVVVKLLNTVDYFHTAVGKFEEYNTYYDGSDSTVNTEYKISTKNVIGGYEKSISPFVDKLMGIEESINELIYNDKKIWRKESVGKTYRVSDYKPELSQDTVTPEQAFSIDLKDLYESDSKFRERPPNGNSNLSLFPYEVTASYLRNEHLWEIEKQNEEVLGHNTIVLYGKLDEKVKNKMEANTDAFRFWVDKDTGILVKYETYGTDGELISYLHPESLAVNVPIDPKEFVPNLDGYNKMDIPKRAYDDPREQEIEVVNHADTFKEETDAVLDLLRTDVPFLYEFTHPDLEIFSASYEKYKDFKHAYLTYSYKKDKNELGSGRRLLYVRAYHKDSIIRSTGDFEREKGEQLEKFTLNSIEWESYKIKNTSNSYFIGERGEYKYEIVSQEITPQETKDLLGSFKPKN
ncbi:hypothetical protein [Bacillus seohaeanensis]|uniref:DUF4367 domain-containing protein n=1 Tax=Bacillus seohaeanensis TaxID=284580 RepID=A0ABW5RNI3_9BACI